MEKNQKPQRKEANQETLDLSHLSSQMEYTFDYEINNIKLDYQNNNSSLNSKMYYFDKDLNAERIVNYNNFKDSLKKKPFIASSSQVYKACFIKHLVSKKKIRFQSSDFDLDMAYITDRVIAMGFPSIGCEKLYRNSINDVIAFFEKYYKSNVKIYNLCLEKNRIYNKNLFSRSKVGLFPSLDHNPCPVKLILEFCVDICLFLIQNLESVAAIHCKAGKGRTGVMICSYLIFSGLCKNSTDAVEYYGKMRTKNCKGVTIPSQIRYIKYFETFLCANFYAPYIYLIPKIIKEHLFIQNEKDHYVKNLLINLTKDSRYYTSPNFFRVNYIKVGPLQKEKPINVSICNFTKSEIPFPKAVSAFIQDVKLPSKNTGLYFLYETNSDQYPINSDIKITLSKGISFYICLNLWYSSLETIEYFLKNNRNKTTSNIIEDDNVSNQKFDLAPEKVEIEMSEIQKENPESNEENFEEEEEGNSPRHKKSKTNTKEKEKSKNFIIFNEDDMEFNRSNQKKNINEIFDESDEIEHRSSLTSSIQHNSELNTVINDLNEIRAKKGKTLFDKSNMIITLTAKQLDKLPGKLKSTDLTVEINYSLK